MSMKSKEEVYEKMFSEMSSLTFSLLERAMDNIETLNPKEELEMLVKFLGVMDKLMADKKQPTKDVDDFSKAIARLWMQPTTKKVNKKRATN